MNTMEYLSDAELLALIETTESQELLTAPKDLKDSILEQVSITPQLSPRRNKRTQLLSYSLRVGLATAASLAFLLLPSPAKDSSQTPATPKLTLTQQLNSFTDRLEQGVDDFNGLFADFDFNFNFGGNRDE